MITRPLHIKHYLEQEGIRRAREQIGHADHILWVFDGQSDPNHTDFDVSMLPAHVPLTYVRNKIDLTGTPAGLMHGSSGPEVAISALTGAGMDALREHLKASCGFSASTEGAFMARRRHLDALDQALVYLDSALDLLRQALAVELVAEDLRQAKQALGEITGEFTPDDLLGDVFSGFCVGK